MTPLPPPGEGGIRALPEASAEPIAPELRIRTLGTPQVWLGEIPLTFRRRKSLALLVYLALTGQAHGRQVLASLFVDQASDAQARERFRTTLTGLVEQVGPFVLVTRETITLERAQPSWLDADELQAATLGPSEGAAVDPQRLERAVALYEGAFLSGFALHDAPLFEDWMQEQRARLERLHVQALQLLLERAREGGDEEAALRWTTRLLAAEPWHEEAYRQLMRLLARRGQRQAALEQYALCCRVLREELGCTPQAATQALYEQLRAGPVAPPHNLPALPGGFLGREREVATLQTRLEDVACRLVTLLGLGGSGKTRLAAQVATHYAQPVALRDEHAFADGVYLVDLAGVGSRVAPGEDAATVLGQRLAVASGRVLGVDFANAADPLPALAGAQALAAGAGQRGAPAGRGRGVGAAAGAGAGAQAAGDLAGAAAAGRGVGAGGGWVGAAGRSLWIRHGHRPVLQRACGGTRIVTAPEDHGLDEQSKGMGPTNVLVPEEAQVGDGEMSQAAGIDNHFAESVTPVCRAAAQRRSQGNGCEDRVADDRDVLDTQVLAALQELERMSRAGLLARLITLYLQEVPTQLAALHEAVAHGDAGWVEEVAHGLRGSSAQLGATRMTSLCTSLQEDAGTHNLSRAAARVADLTREFSRVQVALEAVLRQTQPQPP